MRVLLLLTFFYFNNFALYLNYFSLIMRFFKRLTIAIIIYMCSVFAWAEDIDNSAAGFFVAMPDDEIEYLNMSIKNEMVELYKIGNSSKARNLFSGESWISYMDSTRIDVTLAAEKCFMTIKVYEQKRGKRVYAVAKTMYTPIADSDICFYNEKMERLNADKIFVRPEFKDFFLKTNNKDLHEVMDKISMMFLKFDVSQDGDLMVSLNDMWLDVLDREVSNMLLQMKKEKPLCYGWDGKRFKEVEN